MDLSINMKTRSEKLFEEAKQHIPGGVNSPVRAFKSVGGNPVFFKSAKGALLYDVDGKEYIDYIGSWGPMILGHGFPAVIAAIKEAAENSTSFGAPTEMEVKLAVLIKKMVPGLEQVRMVNSGTEACMSAIRLARGFTGKDKIIKFAGCYHGHADSFLIKAGSGAGTLGIPESLGVPAGVSQDTLIAEYNDIESVVRCIKSNKNKIAAVIMEPVAGNMGCIPPGQGFTEHLRQLCTDNDIILIFDEVMTGFRVARGGAAETLGVEPDLFTFGKIIGGGLPVGAFGGKKEIMNQLAPEGAVYQAGTLSGNPLAMICGYMTLTTLNDNPVIYKDLEKKGAYLEEELSQALGGQGIEHQINRVGSMISVHFCRNKVVDFESAKQGDNDRFKSFFHTMLNSGIYLPPSPYESWFISHAHSKEHLDKTVEVAANWRMN